MVNKIFEEKIQKVKLTKKEKLIAEFFLDEKNQIFLMTSTQIAKALNMSDTTIIRFIKKLGYESFGEFKSNGQNKLKNHLNKVNTFIHKVEILKENSLEQILLDNINVNVNKIFQENSLKKLQKIAKTITKKNNKYVVGLKSTAGLAKFLAIRLGFMLPNTTLLDIDDSTLINSLYDIKKDDVVILFDYPMYSKTSKIIAKMTSENGATLIVFSNSESAPSYEYSNIFYKINLNSISLFNSLISSQILVEYLLSYISTIIGEEYKDRFSQIKANLIEKL